MLGTDILGLPGPQAFMDRVCSDVEAGRSALLVFPRSIIDVGLANDVVDIVGARLGAGQVQQGKGHLPTMVAEALDYLDEWRPSGDPWWDLAHWPAMRGRAATLRSWEHDVVGLVHRWEALTHEAGSEPTERLCLVVGAGLADVEATHLDRTPSLHFSVHWWWGVIDRLDTELSLRRRFGVLDPLAHAELVERTSWDISDMARTSAGMRSDFVGAEGNTVDGPCPPRMAMNHDRAVGASRKTPPVAVRPWWDRGEVDVWDGRYRPSGSGPWADSESKELRWRAQVQILFPYLEEHRRRIQQDFLPKARQAGLAIDPDDAWELGQMFWAARDNQVKVSLQTYEHLKRARNVRNALAHGRPAERRDIEALLEIIPL